MSYANGEFIYTVCDVCGHDKECFIQYDESGEEQAVCPDCLRLADRD